MIEVGTFAADLTPGLGEVLDCGLDEDSSLRVIDHPILAKGVVLRDDENTCVLCAFDWGAICNDAHDYVRQALADAAGTAAERVAAQTVHQHTTVGADTTAQRILDEAHSGLTTVGVPYFESAVQKVAGTVRDAMKNLRPVTHVGTGWAPADRLAASRRIRLPDGTLGSRLSTFRLALKGLHGVAGYDDTSRRWPEGKVDGFVRTVTLFNLDEPIVALHYYASHPQSHYGDGRVTYDVPGLARERLQSEGGVFQIYFTGCGGDVAFGKYNDGDLGTRPQLADRLYTAMLESSQRAKPELAVTSIGWRSVDLPVGPRTDPEFSESQARATVMDSEATPYARIRTAMLLAFIERAKAGHRLDISCLTLGPVKILNLPGEMFVEYQLFAQRAVSDGAFIAVAAYGDCAVWYVCTDEAYTDDGGYEQIWSFIDPSERIVKDAIALALS